ncbi:GNAT family N-acetyltransferase [Aspergillus mulundensis]|uniref:N-acetyltransferase domain-containing protein n=1 Tax=Aspergillus mulundensis TaxID=1810919 RepID=A0A3D8SUX1_9EURO|nr:hypothetical protein DSM5745_01865 [Aspergillus mulundensis]RDW90090.1 hypothetical protein DSM5745_01865 [Aspergillus mulundensis]
MKAARDNLFQNEHFLNKYRSGPGLPKVVTKKSPPLKLVGAIGKEIHGLENGKAISKSASLTSVAQTQQATSPEITASTIPVAAPSNLELDNTKSFPTSLNSSYSLPSKTNNLTQPRPCIPLTRAEALSIRTKAKHYLSSAVKKSPRPCIPRIEVHHVPDSPQHSSSLEQVLESSLLAPTDTSKAPVVISSGDTILIQSKMAASNASDEVLARPRKCSKWKADESQLGPRPSRRLGIPRPSCNQEQTKRQTTQGGFLSTDHRRISQNSNQLSDGLHKGVSLPVDYQCNEPTSPTFGMQENRYNSSGKDVENELGRLQKEILIKAHRAVDLEPTACPEVLTMCREGPGTDRTSGVYREMGNLRAVEQDIPDTSYLPGSSQVFSTETEEGADSAQLKNQLCSRLRIFKESYKKSPKAFPVLQNEEFLLAPCPTREHERALAKIQADRERAAEPASPSTGGNQATQVLNNSWTDPAIVDWEYCPRDIRRLGEQDEIAWRARLQGWLETTIQCECAVDIFRHAFFNGSAHADGETAMFILDMRNYQTVLDPNDEKSQAHAHETVAGYCYNFNLRKRKLEEAEEHRKIMSRQAELEARRQPLRSSNSPVANIYLRPVNIDKDIEELMAIYNWYTEKSFISPNIYLLNENNVRERIEESQNAHLPFIVAVERRTEKVVGYALARDFDRQEASRFTAELELYVADDHTSLGIGRCLLDKLLEICDPTYTPKCGYSFEVSKAERSGYFSGGRRRLSRLIFALSYVDMKAGDISKHKRVKQWLKERGEFEEQGLLGGARVKNNYLVNVAYLVRSIGPRHSNKLVT